MSTSRRLRRIVAFLACSLVSVSLFAQQAPPSADTFVSSSTPNANYGSGIIIAVGSGTTGYLKFNLSDVPAGATVSKASLRLYVDAVVTGGQFDVYNLPSTPVWSENTLKFNSPPPPLGTSATGGHPITISASSINSFLLIDITPTVKAWLLNPASNNGIALAPIGTTGYYSFDSKESIFTAHQPELEIVLSGPAGTQGPQGVQGPQGLPGSVGPQGAIGPQGSKGDTGATGATGPTGASGPKGDTGATGATGPQGNVGNTGPIGPQGNVGAPGAIGPQGNTGPQGNVGATGPIGPQGPQGNVGNTGPIGPIGPTGPPGANGTNGTNGTNGVGFNFTGPFNPSTSYNPNDVATFNGSTYVATVANQNAGTPDVNTADWTLMAQEGATGPQGNVGTTGATGAQGIKGDTGAPGATGPQGNVGNTGATGATGPQGAKGDTGNTGAIGPIGPQGPPGPQGPQGVQGDTGATGTQGPQGPAGTNGNSNARMIFTSFFPGNLTGTWVGGQFVIDQAITVLRVAASAKAFTLNNCPAAVFRFTDGTKGQDLPLTPGQYWSDSGPITLTFAAGATLQSLLRTGTQCAVTGSDVNLMVEYKMQESGDTDSCPGTLCSNFCETTSTDPSNCGSCANACPSGAPCNGGSCGCDPGQTSCSGTCVNLTNDVHNCGMCNFVCNSNNATPACVNGACKLTCNAGFADCDNNPADGCEVNINSDVNNCGGCGLKCSSGQVCTGGSCASAPLLPNGAACSADSQCLSNACNASSHVCVQNQCADNQKDGSETDIDCGGGVCPGCALTKHCNIDNDCLSNACDANNHTCVSSQCFDHQQDGAETDIDCGGPNACARCASGQTCMVPSDCAAGLVCLSNKCQ